MGRPKRHTTWLDPVRGALDEATEHVDLFVRDDDVGWEDVRLWRLLDLFEEHALAIDLAVIPMELSPRLARHLQARSESELRVISWHQHGFAHANHESTERKHEFGPSRPGWLQRRDIVEGQARVRDLLGKSDPIFTPPWNRCTQTTGQCLVELGFEALSRESRAESLAIPKLAEVPVNVDWFAHRKGVRLSRMDLGKVLAKVVRQSGRIGLMLHHAEMNGAEREASKQLLSLFASHDSVRSRAMLELVRQAKKSKLVIGAER
jgi:peptidoglycan/xylan/chitin deacetylase (PgdA/CDA1 family)